VSFLVEPQNQGRVSWFSLKTKVDGFSRFGLKTGGCGFCGLASKPLAWVSRFEPQNQQLRFGDLDLKSTSCVSWFGPQNHAGYNLPVVPQNRQEDDSARGTGQDLAACFTWK
jgi:hypothetical protein